MSEFDRLTRILEWRLEYFGRIMNVLEEVGDRLEGAGRRLVMWGYHVIDCIFNYKTSNAASALRHADYILGEPNV